jgi:hypothetical protein
VNVNIFSFNKCPIYTHDGASAKFSPNSQEMDNSVLTDISSSKITKEEGKEEDINRS